MVKKSLLLFCFCLICFFSFLCSFGIGITYADSLPSTFAPVYSYTGLNLGFCEWGFNDTDDVDSLNSFSKLNKPVNYTHSYDSFMCRFRFDVAVSTSNASGYLFAPMFQIKNDDYRLYPYNVNYDYLPSDNYFNLGGAYLTASNDLVTNSNSLLFTDSLVLSLTDGYVGTSSFNQKGLIAFSLYYTGNVNITTFDLFNSISSSYVTFIEIGSSNNFAFTGVLNTELFTYDGKFNYCAYHFSNNLVAIFAVGVYSGAKVDLLWDYRLYSFTDSSLQDVYYNQGYNAGVSAGYSDGNSAGYSLGYDNGLSDGRSIGFNEGVASANDYSFFSLISAVIDAPITAFKSLFNFDFLGFNMLNFVTGLITFCFVIWIVRLIL